NNRDIGLWVTNDGVDLFSTILGNSMRQIVSEEINTAIKDLFSGMLEGAIKGEIESQSTPTIKHQGLETKPLNEVVEDMEPTHDNKAFEGISNTWNGIKETWEDT